MSSLKISVAKIHEQFQEMSFHIEDMKNQRCDPQMKKLQKWKRDAKNGWREGRNALNMGS